MNRLRTLLLLALACAFAWPAQAHLTPNSEVKLDFGPRAVIADVVIPLGELGYALGRPLAPRAGPLAGETARRVLGYLTPRITAIAPDGRRWTTSVETAAIATDVGAPDLRVRLRLAPPAGAPARRFDLAYRAVIDRVPNHFVLVLVRTDYGAGRLSDRPQMLGGLQPGAERLTIDRGPGSAWRGFRSAVDLGMHHIAEGHDHLLFLIALLLPAPLLARGRRWAGYEGLRPTARLLARIVTAFTIGHSLTLIGGAFLGWTLPARPVEIGIALSILVSAVHAWRPLFAGREALVAGGFGLVHGLAFATLIGRFGLDPWQKAQSILGFNLGIELVQLIVVAAALPALLLLAPTPAYAWVRIGGALLAGVAAAAWLAERAIGVDNAIGRAIDAGLGHAPWLLAVVTLAAAAFRIVRREKGGAA
ncbi:MAG: HupE/UreJ family protein [Sphingomonas sp.]